MVEVPAAGEVQRETSRSSRLHDLLIADRAARLHDGLHAGIDEHLLAPNLVQQLGFRPGQIDGRRGDMQPGGGDKDVRE